MKQAALILLFLILLCSCDSNLVLSDNQEFTGTGWAIDSPAIFKIDPPDTLQSYDLFINLRNTGEYEFNNLYLISQIKFPFGKTITDTLEYQMSDPQGRFLGAGTRDVFENKLWLKKGVRFRESGTYQLLLKQAMRKNGEVNGVPELKGILDVGYSIEKQVIEDGSN